MNLDRTATQPAPAPAERHGRRCWKQRLHQAQAEPMAPIDLFMATLVNDELTRRSDRLLERRRKQASFRDPDKTLDNFDFQFNPKLNRSLVFDLATGGFIDRREDALFLGPGGTGKSHLAQGIGQAAVLQVATRVIYRRNPHPARRALADATLDGTRKQYMESVSSVALLIIDDFGMRKLPQTAAEDLLEIVMRRYERASTLLTSNRLCGELHNRFNAKSSFMLRAGIQRPVCNQVEGFSLRITGVAFSIAIN